MRTLFEYVSEAAPPTMAKFSKDIKLEFVIAKSYHAADRQDRHDDEGLDEISDDEILETVRKCSERIIEDLIANKIDIGDRFVVQDAYQSPMLNIVCQTHRGSTKDEIRVDIVTVIRTDKFWNTKKSWVIRIK